MVEAIDEGRIVRVSEDYAKREGLPIIRKISSSVRREEFLELGREGKKNPGSERKHLMDDFRKPLDWKKQKIVKDLVNNFHWEIKRKRKELGMTRADLAKKIGDSEETLKLLENGILPKNDFVLVNKVQDALGVQLMRGEEVFKQEMRKLVEDNLIKIEKEEKEEEDESIYGKGIELIEEDEDAL